MAVKARAEITLSSIRDVQSVTRYYLLQSSTSAVPSKPTTNPPGGNWVTSEPTYTSGSTNSLYFVDLTVFSDDSFDYSDVSLSSSYEAAKVAYNKAENAEDIAGNANDKIDNLQIGGRNLLLNSEHFAPGTGIFSGSNSNLYTSAAALDGEGAYNASGSKYVKVTFPNLIAGKQYVFSCEVARQSGGVATPVYITIGSNNPINVGTAQAATWRSFSTIFTASESTTYALVQVYTAASSGNSGWVGHFRRFKLERGTVTTDWTPAPEDIEADISASQATADSKNTVYYQASAPSGGTYKVNDIWFDTDNGNKMYMWNGNAWTAETFGTAAISNLAITNAKIANGTIENAKIANLDAGKVTSGTMSAARIKGDELKLGGDNNTDGVMKVYNANGELVGSFTKEGLMAIAGTIAGWTINPGEFYTEWNQSTSNYKARLSTRDGLKFEKTNSETGFEQFLRQVIFGADNTVFLYRDRDGFQTAGFIRGIEGTAPGSSVDGGISISPNLLVTDGDGAIYADQLRISTIENGSYVRQPQMIMAGKTSISGGTSQKRATICSIPTAYRSGWRIVPFVTRAYGNSGVAPADNGDFYYAYYNSADHEVDIKLANLLPSGVVFTFDYMIYAVPETT